METTSRGFLIHCLDHGSGPALVLIPGLLMSVARWQAIGYVDAFARDYRVLAVDPLGHGLSDKPHDPGAYLLEDCARDVLAVMDAVSVDSAHVWGYSRGAAIALALALAAPHRLLSLVVGGASLQLQPLSARATNARMVQMTSALRAGDWEKFWMAQGLRDRANQVILEQGQDSEAIACLIEARPLSSLSRTGFDPSVLARPPLVYLGELEPMLELATAEALAAGAQLHIVPGREHAGAFQDIAKVEPVVSAYLSQSGRQSEG